MVGKREDSFSIYKNLLNKIRLIDGKISSVKINDDIEIISPCERFSLGAMIENYVDGEELKLKINFLAKKEKINIGERLAQFIIEMQTIKCNFDKNNEIEKNLNKYQKSLNLLGNYLSKDIISNLVDIKSLYKNFMMKSEFYLTHGDLQEANILINERNELSGIIDFGNMEYYVPEVEFAPMMEYDEIIFKSMIDNYNKKIDLKNILLIKLVRQVRHFKHVINLEDKFIKDEIEKIISLNNKIIQYKN